MLKKVNEFNEKFSSLFFLVALFIIIIFIVYSLLNKNGNSKICTIPNKIINNSSNYSYDIEYIKENKKVTLYVKRYNDKYLIEKNDNGERKTYYLYYTNIYEKASDGEYIIYRRNNIVDGFDNKFVIFDYIDDISLNSTAKEDDGITCFFNRKLELNICINLDKTVTVKGNDFEINYNIKEKGTNQDFNIDLLEYNNYIEDNNSSINNE